MAADSPPARADRRLAIQVALQALYEADAAAHPVGAVVQRLAEREALAREPAEFARRLVAGVTASSSRIDGLIAETAPTWPLSQMARIDRNILRLAIYEGFIDNAAVPVRAVINDAIELAKTFGSEGSGKFVNGVLATLAERLPRAPLDRIEGHT